MNTIEFPNLNLTFRIQPEIFSIGPFSVHWYGLLISIGFILAVIFGLRYARTRGIKPDTVIDMLLVTVPIAIIGARLYYVLFTLPHYLKYPLDALKIWEGGLAIYGAVIAVVITVPLLARRRKINPLLLFDIAMPYIALAQAVGRWGNFVNQEAFGGNTNLPWAMTGNLIRGQLIFMAVENEAIDPNLPVHPTFLYESLWCLLIFGFMLLYRRRWQKNHGEVFALYFITYGIGRAFIEGLRTDSLMFLGMRVSQVLSVLMVIAALAYLVFLRRRTPVLVPVGQAEATEQADVSVQADISEPAEESVQAELSESAETAAQADTPRPDGSDRKKE